MANLQTLLNTAKVGDAEVALVTPAGKTKAATTEVSKVRQIHMVGEVNTLAYFQAEVKASLRMVQAKTGNSVKDCSVEALRDLFKKHNVPVSVELGEGR